MNTDLIQTTQSIREYLMTEAPDTLTLAEVLDGATRAIELLDQHMSLTRGYFLGGATLVRQSVDLEYVAPRSNFAILDQVARTTGVVLYIEGVVATCRRAHGVLIGVTPRVEVCEKIYNLIRLAHRLNWHTSSGSWEDYDRRVLDYVADRLTSLRNTQLESVMKSVLQVS